MALVFDRLCSERVAAAKRDAPAELNNFELAPFGLLPTDRPDHAVALLLLEHKAVIDPRTFPEPSLFLATTAPMAQALVERKADVNAAKDGVTPLLYLLQHAPLHD